MARFVLYRHDMRHSRVLVASLSAIVSTLVATSPAYAQLVPPDPKPLTKDCEFTQERPYPVVVVHGQSGKFEEMNGINDRLVAEGYCVFGTNYGSVVAGINGQDHLWNSAAQVGSFIDAVMARTDRKMVEVVGHSAGTGVLANYILQRDGAKNVHSFVSFGGLHHPYWHLGVPRYFDIDIHLPNLWQFGQQFLPGITIDQVTEIIGMFVTDPLMHSTITSPFAKDLFDANYWNTLHGGSSEPPGVFVKMNSQGRSIPTRDSVPGICNTNIVAVGDMLVGGAAGWQDVGPHVDNFLTESAPLDNAHNSMMGDQASLDKMIAGIKRTCGNMTMSLTTQSLSPLNDAAASAEAAELKKTQAERQREFGKEFLMEALDRFGDELERSDKPLPWEPGGEDIGAPIENGTGTTPPPTEEPKPEPNQASGDGGSVSACSVSHAREGGGTVAMALGGLGLAFAIRSRRKSRGR